MKIAIPEDVKAVHFKVEVRYDKYYYLYSFDGKTYNKNTACI